MPEPSLRDQALSEVLDSLAAGTATPGGGGAAGVTGAMAAALVAMVARLTLDKKGYERVREAMAERLERAEALRAELLDGVERDVAAFDAVMDAFRLPKDTEEQKSARAERVQAALRDATEVPYETARAALGVLTLAAGAIAEGNRNAASDAAAAVHLAHAAAQAALLNVDINLGSIRDEAFSADYRAKRAELARSLEARHSEALAAVLDRLA